jgi:hypothetical protein
VLVLLRVLLYATCALQFFGYFIVVTFATIDQNQEITSYCLQVFKRRIVSKIVLKMIQINFKAKVKRK